MCKSNGGSSEKNVETNPFAHMLISSTDCLDSCDKRSICPECHRSARFFCYRCVRLCDDLEASGKVPVVRLPFDRLLIVKDSRELDGKSTAVHAKLLAPTQVELVTYTRDGPPPAILESIDSDSSVLLFPSRDSKSVSKIEGWFDFEDVENNIDSIDKSHQSQITNLVKATSINKPRSQSIGSNNMKRIKTVVVIDGTWNQAKSMANKCLPIKAIQRKIHLDKNNRTAFWRYQNLGPHCLATIEAIHRLCVEVSEFSHQIISENLSKKAGSEKDNPDDSCLNQQQPPPLYIDRFRLNRENCDTPENLDNLLFFFSFFYHLIQKEYSRSEKSFTKRHRAGYIYKAKDDDSTLPINKDLHD